MNITPTSPTDAHEKTIDLRISRLRSAIAHADITHTQRGTHDATLKDVATRTLVILIENRAFVAAHAQALIDDIVRNIPRNAQDARILEDVRPTTILLERANVAIARTRALLDEHEEQRA